MTWKGTLGYLLLLLLPTLALGVAGVIVLRHEEERYLSRHDEAAATEARLLADQVDLTVRQVLDTTLTQLTDTANNGPWTPGDLVQRLIAWQDRDPFVRNIYLWQPPDRILYPAPDHPANDEERRFLARYDALFSGRTPWPEPRHGNLSELHFQVQIRPPGTPILDATRGWITWYADNQLHLLAVYRPTGGAMTAGIELETVALLARLVPTLPVVASGPDRPVLALADNTGSIVHTAEALSLTVAGTPQGYRTAARASIDALPNWHVVAHFPTYRTGRDSRFLLIASLLLAILLVAILAGGTLFLLQARRHRLDALQKTSFVANVSHELKTPLTAIRMYAEMLQDGRAKDDAKRQRYLGVIVDQTERLTRLVNNVLDFSRLEQGRRPYAREALDLSVLAANLLDAQACRCQQSGMSVATDFATDAIADADRDAVEQILLNLVDNAIKYAAEGGTLRLVTRRLGDRVELRVQDRGPGVPPAARRRLFAAFERGDEALTARAQGTGLGLSIARRLARDLGGDLTCEPGPEGGACFVLTLPAVRQEAPARPD